MRIYIRQIRPVFYRSSGHGFAEIREPLIDAWFDEKEKDELIKIYNPKVEEKDPYGILEFDERYIPIEVETLEINDKDTIIISIDPNEINHGMINSLIKKIRNVYNNTVIVKFKGTDIEK